MRDVCVGRGWCGGLVDGKPSHVDDYIPESGPVSADQFVEWLFAAEGYEPAIEPADRVKKFRADLKALFISTMGAEIVAASELKWDLGARRSPKPARMNETAYAKINLALHVRGRREDGYHEIETLFAFVDVGDELAVEIAARDELRVTGEFAPQLTDPFGNIVAKALTRLPRPEGWRVTLDKRLPVAAGVGGGSADAGALFRLVRERFGLPEDWRERAAKLGADVPACVESRTCIGRGTGTELEPSPQDLAGTPVLLVNPRVPLATGPVFAAWDGLDRGGLPEGTARDIALAGRNDLEALALTLCPISGEVLAALRDTNAWLVRMSGSGATVFALFETAAQRDDAARILREDRPEWWQMSGALR